MNQQQKTTEKFKYKKGSNNVTIHVAIAVIIIDVQAYFRLPSLSHLPLHFMILHVIIINNKWFQTRMKWDSFL